MKWIYEYEKKANYTNDPEEKRKSDEYIKQYEEMQKHKHNLEKRREEVEVYSEALKISKEKEKARVKKDWNHELKNRIIRKYKVSELEAHKMIQGYDPPINDTSRNYKNIKRSKKKE